LSNLEPLPDPQDLHQYADSVESSAGHAQDLTAEDLRDVLLPDDEQRDYYGDKLSDDPTLTAEDAQGLIDADGGLVAEPYDHHAGRHLRGVNHDAAAVSTTGLVVDDTAGDSVENAIELKEVAGLSQSRIVMRRFLRHRGAMVALTVLAAVILLAATSIGWGPIPGWWPYNWTELPPIVNHGGAPTMGFRERGTVGPEWLWYLLAALVALALVIAGIIALLSTASAKAETKAFNDAAQTGREDGWVGYSVPATPKSDRLYNLARSVFKWALLGAGLFALAYLITHLEIGPHPFGQDNIGRDGFARVMRGTQQSLTIMAIIGVLATFIGVVLGALSGFFRGHVDNIIMRFTDMVITIPTIVMGAILGVWVGGASPVLLALALSFMVWTGMARLVRAQFLALREQEFVDAARVAGASNFRIMFKHILPNAVGIIIVNATLLMASAILLETALSFLGFGITAPDVSLGQIINEYQDAFNTRPWLFWWPGLFIVTIALCVNFIGDGLRDAFDPRQRRIPTARALARADARKAAAAARGTFGRPAAPSTTAIPVVTAIPEHLDPA